MDVPAPRDIIGAARVAQSLAYVVGAAGVIAGAVAYRADGDVAGALLVWVLTFAAGALLMVVSLLARSVAVLLARTEAMERDLRVLLGRHGQDEDPPRGRDPWSGDHPNAW